jgi:hypothetical protein
VAKKPAPGLCHEPVRIICPGNVEALFADWIEQLAAEGITEGYCSGKLLSRQLDHEEPDAVFLTRALSLQ